jgi:hypothetical protein
MEQTAPPSGEIPGKFTTKRIAIGVVTKIDVAGPGTLVVARGTRSAVAVSAMPEDQERVEVKADGDTLRLSFKGGLLLNREPTGEVRYEVAVASIEEIRLGDGIVAEVMGLETKEVKVRLGGGSRLTVSGLQAMELEVEAGGGSQVVAAGTVDRQKVKLGGGSIYQGTGLASREAEVEASGGSDASILTGERLKVRASGGSTVTYTGEGVELDVKTEAGSDLRQIAGV